MTLMVEKSITGGICRAIYGYRKANNKCMNDYNKNKERLYIIAMSSSYFKMNLYSIVV